MTVREFTKSGTFVLLLLGAVLIGLPFAVEQIGEATGFFAFPATKWVKDLFVSAPTRKSARLDTAKIDWEQRVKDLKAFSEWAEGQGSVRISIVRPETFQIVRADPNPATAARFAWKLQLISEELRASVQEVRDKLVLVCEPEGAVTGKLLAVEPLGGGEKGFRVTVGDVRGEGKMGLSYAGLPPVYYDVKLRRLWLVPVSSCRGAVTNLYDAAAFFAGMDNGFPEGTVISPSSDKCGYRILSVSDRCVWFEAFYGNEPPADELPHSIWPDFARVDTMSPTPPPGRLIFGRNRCFWPGDAIRLPNSGTYLMVDDFLAGRAVVFRLLDAAMRPFRELLCVIVREK